MLILELYEVAKNPYFYKVFKRCRSSELMKNESGYEPSVIFLDLGNLSCHKNDHVLFANHWALV